jgi:hypothetical protein
LRSITVGQVTPRLGQILAAKARITNVFITGTTVQQNQQQHKTKKSHSVVLA